MDVPVETLTPPPPEVAPEATPRPPVSPRTAGSPPEPPPESPGDASLAHDRVVAYCRSLGLTDHSRAQQVAKRVVQAVVAEHPDADGRVWMRLAVERLQAQVTQWLDALSNDSQREKHWIAASLPAILRQRPEMFLQTTDLPRGWRHGVVARPLPQLPPSSHSDMPRQCFGKPPAILRPGFWFRLWRWVKHEQHPIERLMRRSEFGARKK